MAAVRPPVVQPGTGNNIVINPNQRLNPVLECVRNVGKEFGDIVCDFQVGRTTGVLFLSLKYHRLHPEYIHQRIEKLGHSYTLRILLVLSDISEHQDPIRDLTKICLINNITVIIAWSAEGAGHYLSTFKQYEHKPPDMIKERTDKDYASVLQSALTSISRVNKTDVATLRTSLGSFANIAKATPAQLQNLPGFGQVKVKRTTEAFEKPFRSRATTNLSSFNLTQAQNFPVNALTSKNKLPIAHPDTLARKVGVNEQEKEATTSMGIGGTSRQVGRRSRAPSPVWDIELDLNSPSPSAGNDPAIISSSSSTIEQIPIAPPGKEDVRSERSPPVYLIDTDSDDG